ncbi:NADP oxidoreductase [Dehalococcoidia bacterium]|nr:NADP oxidoreductase [Dehalococcoidia bacterium]MCL0081777.1 NADP oxidoreductase [Dehalococcoidia bacterium]
MAKVKIATDWLEICSGCHMSLLDIDERIVELVKHVQFTSSPITDLKHPPKDGVDVGILTGGVGNTHQEEVAMEMRERCKILVALGDCAVFGGIVTMRNFFDKEEALRRAYVETEGTDEGGAVPRSDELGKLLDREMALNEVVKVDVHIPGCPPPADAIWFALTELLAGRIPVLTGDNLTYE